MAEYIPKESPDDDINITNMSPTGLLLQASVFLFIIAGACYLFLLLIPGWAAKATPLSFETKLVEKISWVSKSQNKLETQPLFEKLKPNLPEHLKSANVSVSSQAGENAFALPGNQILITQDFLDNAVYKNEKLFVLAHELGHLHFRHPLKSFYRTFLGQAVLGLLGNSSSLASLTTQMTSLSFNREEEKKADLYALDLLFKSTGDIKGAFNFFERMKKKYGKWEGVSGSLFSTHPVSAERLEYLNEAAKAYSKN